MLPSGYTPIIGLYGGAYTYIDTEIVAKSTLSVQISLSVLKDSTAIGYIFGARNSNSNTSAGQVGLYIGASGSADYFCWASARVSQTLPSTYTYSGFNFSNDTNEAVLNAQNNFVSLFTGATTAFTGTRNIHLFGLNNAGSHTSPNASFTVFGFKVWDDGSLICNMVPAYEEATSTAGMYDLARNRFFGSSSNNSFNISRTVEVQSGNGGKAGISVEDLGLYDKVYTNSSIYRKMTAVAVPDEDHVFKNWTVNGTEVSTDIEYTFDTNTDMVLVANFDKRTDIEQRNPYTAIALPYDEMLGTDTKLNASYLEVLDFSISEDVMQRSTSTIVCKEIPSTLKINVPIFLYNPLGKIIFYGAIKSIEDKVLTCREPVYLYDDDFVDFASYYNSHFNVMRYMYQSLADSNDKTTAMQDIWTATNQLPVDSSLLVNTPMAQISENAVVNGEDRIIDMFLNYGLICKYSFYKSYYNSNVTWRMGVEAFNPARYGKLLIGDNSECIRNISITTTEADATYLQIYNSSGSSSRGTFAIKYDGTIGEVKSGVNLNQFVYYKGILKRKIVFSDDNVKTIARENLSNSLYQHKIEFDLDLNGLYSFDDIKLGRQVSFYCKDKNYDSIITGRNYSLENGKINRVHVVMGIARTNLTSLLNLKKVK